MNDELKHHGIKGMKWGVRRSPEELANADVEGVGGGGGEDPEENAETLLDELKDFIEGVGETLEDIGSRILDTGSRLYNNMTGGGWKEVENPWAHMGVIGGQPNGVPLEDVVNPKDFNPNRKVTSHRTEIKEIQMMILK